jgi:hypothetical protein
VPSHRSSEPPQPRTARNHAKQSRGAIACGRRAHRRGVCAGCFGAATGHVGSTT